MDKKQININLLKVVFCLAIAIAGNSATNDFWLYPTSILESK